MDEIKVALPDDLDQAVRVFSNNNHIDVETFILWAVAEKVGALKEQIINRALMVETLKDKYVRIVKVVPIESDYSLHVIFDGGLRGDYALTPLIRRGGVYSALADPALFRIAKVAGRGEYVEWNGEITLGADRLFAEIILSGSFTFDPNKKEDE